MMFSFGKICRQPQKLENATKDRWEQETWALTQLVVCPQACEASLFGSLTSHGQFLESFQI